MKTLIIAFDGLDYELIKKYNCENIKQKEFSKIQLHNSKKIKTSEEFASFITGKTWRGHGIKGHYKYPDNLEGRILSLFSKHFENFRGFHRLRRILEAVFGVERRLQNKSDLKSKSLFDEINKSKPIYVPSYNPSFAYELWGKVNGIKDKQRFADMEFKSRKEKLFRGLQNEYSLIMCHFHKPDAYHHLFWELDKKQKIKEMYKEMDQLAKKIKNKAQDKYDCIIFMSDHGLPTEHEHNKNAFYSCNKELFADKTPHITDFHDKILKLVKEEKETSGI